MRLENAEEIISIHDLAASLCKIILNKSKESFIANAGTQILKEMNTVKIYRYPIRFKTLGIVNGNIHKAVGLKKVNSILPPPGKAIRMQRFVIHSFRVCSESFI